MSLGLNLDIWLEIFQYFNYPEDKDTLRSLAIASRCLSDLALDRVWWKGKRAVDIVWIINSFASSPSQPILAYKKEVDRYSSFTSTSYINSADILGSWVSFSRLELVKER